MAVVRRQLLLRGGNSCIRGIRGIETSYQVLCFYSLQNFVDGFLLFTVFSSCRSLVLVATSGDTGGAVLNAFTRHAGQ